MGDTVFGDTAAAVVGHNAPLAAIAAGLEPFLHAFNQA